MRLAFAVLLFGVTSAARAQDAFEVQVYDSETASAGSMGVEFHANAFLHDSNTLHFTLEPHLGLASWCETGMYFTTALSPGGRFDFAGVKLRFKVRWPEKLGGFLGLALNQELSMGGGTYDDSGFEWELRPVIDADFSRVYLSFNPIISTAITGPEAGTASIEPALKASFKILEALAVGAEYYMGLGSFHRLAPLAEQTHRLFGAVDLKFKVGKAELGLNLGAGYTLIGQDKLIIKAIVSADFD